MSAPFTLRSVRVPLSLPVQPCGVRLCPIRSYTLHSEGRYPDSVWLRRGRDEMLVGWMDAMLLAFGSWFTFYRSTYMHAQNIMILVKPQPRIYRIRLTSY